MKKRFHVAALLLVGLGAAAGASAQQRASLSAADYDRAVRFLAPSLTGLVVRGSVAANWLPGDGC